MSRPTADRPIAARHPGDPSRAGGPASSVAADLRSVGVAAVGGLVLGVGARAWMRLIADEPAYTRSGTTFIVVGFAFFATAQAVATVLRGRAHHRLVVASARVVAVVGLLPLFVGAGGQMLPVVVGGGFASARRGWPRAGRIACLLVAAGPLALVASGVRDDFGWSLRSTASVVAMIALYSTIVRVARPAFEARPDGRRLPVPLAVAGAIVLALLLSVLMVGVARS